MLRVQRSTLLETYRRTRERLASVPAMMNATEEAPAPPRAQPFAPPKAQPVAPPKVEPVAAPKVEAEAPPKKAPPET
jgi:hypothetical protein